MRTLKRIYWFLLIDHSVGFMRASFLMLIPCAFSELIARAWLIFVATLCIACMFAAANGWSERTCDVCSWWRPQTHTCRHCKGRRWHTSPEGSCVHWERRKRKWRTRD